MIPPLDFDTVRREHTRRVDAAGRHHRSSRLSAARLRTWGRRWR
jgi:hypothetical protein